MAAGMLGGKAQAARARGQDEDVPPQQQVARRLVVHGQQARSGTASSSGRGLMRAVRCERTCTTSTGGSGESCAGLHVRARSGLQLEQAARMCSLARPIEEPGEAAKGVRVRAARGKEKKPATAGSRQHVRACVKEK
jgi:hypothetical protein